MKAPAPHPLADMDVTLPDGRRAKVVRVFEACVTQPERCMVDLGEGAPIDRFTIKPAAELKVAR